MISMAYDSANYSLKDLLRPVVAAEDALARLDERVARKGDFGELGSRQSKDGLLRENEGWIARSHFMEACNALWLAGELVHVEDLVLHDARMDIRTPTHELTRAHAILRTRRQIASSPAQWALSPKGIASLRGRWGSDALLAPIVSEPVRRLDVEAAPEPGSEAESAFEEELAKLDALLDRSERLLKQPKPTRDNPPARVETTSPGHLTPDGDSLVYDPDWDEDGRMEEWFAVMDRTRDLPPMLAAALLWDAWEEIEPLQHQHWLGPMLVASMLRERLKTRAHLAVFNAGLRAIPRDRRRARDRNARLTAFLEAAQSSAIASLKEIDRLSLARVQMERKLKDRRSTSSLPGMIDLILSRPMVSTALIAKELKVTPRGALNLIGELGVREMTGRGRYRAWGIV
ncbi:DNA binding protein with HTH domain [Phyllobacterium myrsinacearum]|nr:DNA binding protein with HTH domain [Phyllobacterium myrsinacearum]